MQPLLDWLIHELQDPAKAATGMLGSTVTFLVLVVFRAVWSERKRTAEEEKKVRPMVCSVPPEPKPPADVPLEVRLRVWQLQDTITELRGRLATCDGQLQASKAEESRIKVALTDARVELAEATDREKALARELADLRRTIDSGFTRIKLPPPLALPSPGVITEIDARPTPRRGTPRPRGI